MSPQNTTDNRQARALEAEQKRRFAFATNPDYHREVLKGYAYNQLTSDKPLPVSYDEAKMLYWHITKIRLGIQGASEYEADEFNRNLIQQLLAYFLGLSGTVQTKKGSFEAVIPTDRGIWLCGRQGVGKRTIMECFSVLMHVLKWRKKAFVVTLPTEVDNAFGSIKNINKVEAAMRPFFKYQRCFVDFDIAEKSHYGKPFDLAQRILNDRFERFRDYKMLTFITSHVDLDSLTMNYNDTEYQDRFDLKTRGILRQYFTEIVLAGDAKNQVK